MKPMPFVAPSSLAAIFLGSRAVSVRPLLGVLAFAVIAMPAVVLAQGPIRVDQLSRDQNTVTIQFTDQRLATNPVLNHAVEFTRSLGVPTLWSNVTGAAFTTLPFNSLGRAAVLPDMTTNGFFRIVGTTSSANGTANDTDGDGLANAFELGNGTNPNLWDSDGDGFSDAVEYQYGTNPNNPSNFPVLTTRPRAEFEEATSLATEGTASHGVTVRFDKPYFGTLKLAVLTNSTARVNVDFLPFPTNVTVAGTSVVIPIRWVDDMNISPTRLLILEVLTDPARPYARAGQTLHTVVLDDNDAYWSGVLADTYAQRNFRLKLIHIGSASQATFVAGAGNDGMPLLAGDTGVIKSSQSVGVVPIGSFAATVQFDETNRFKISSPVMPAATGGLFGPSTGLTRTLVLESLPVTTDPPNGQSIIPGRVIGSYTECLAFPGQAPCATQTGDFVLVRDLPARPSINR